MEQPEPISPMTVYSVTDILILHAAADRTVVQRLAIGDGGGAQRYVLNGNAFRHGQFARLIGDIVV